MRGVITLKDIFIFERVEKKYRITLEQKHALLDSIKDNLIPDSHGISTICSLYLDTPDRLLIRNSIDAKTYKEKLRIRSYGAPTIDDKVFLEIKKKFKGIVYKRRVALPLWQVMEYVNSKNPPIKSQIMSEIDYAMNFYKHPKPSMVIAYEREAFFAKDDPTVRITFDTGVRFREKDLLLENGTDGRFILPDDAVIMEIKTSGAMPMWLSSILNSSGIFPTSFSKYGTAYRQTITSKGENSDVCNI